MNLRGYCRQFSDHSCHLQHLNPFPQEKNLDQTKFKAFADNKLNVTKIIISVFDRVENIVGQGEVNKELTLYQTKKFYPCPKLNAFAKDSFIAAQMPQFFCDRVEKIVENIVEKEENAGNQHFTFSTFSKGFFLRVVKTWDCLVKSETALKLGLFENMGKEENSGKQHFLLFPQRFYPSQNKFQCKCFQFGIVQKFVVW